MQPEIGTTPRNALRLSSLGFVTCFSYNIHVIQVSNLTKAYGTQVVFDDVGFTVNAGERIGLVGRNGSGKTTLLRMITGEAKPDAGVISIPNNYRIGYLSQHLQFKKDTVLKEACLGLPPVEDGRDESYKAEAVLMGLGFSIRGFFTATLRPVRRVPGPPEPCQTPRLGTEPAPPR